MNILSDCIKLISTKNVLPSFPVSNLNMFPWLSFGSMPLFQQNQTSEQLTAYWHFKLLSEAFEAYFLHSSNQHTHIYICTSTLTQTGSRTAINNSVNISFLVINHPSFFQSLWSELLTERRRQF